MGPWYISVVKPIRCTIFFEFIEYQSTGYWMQHVNKMPRNRLPRVMKRYSPTGRRNHGRPLKRLLDTWDRNGSTSGPTPWHMMMMFRTVSPSIIRSQRLYIQVYVIHIRWLLASGHEMEQEFHLVPAGKQSTNVYDTYLKLYVQSLTHDDGRRGRPKHAEWYSINAKQLCV